uniref:Uncharacterized protein n=1 Tax=Anguilla anguilla TaxID=7936 RepID=A0A0E9W4V2_ANGAN
MAHSTCAPHSRVSYQGHQVYLQYISLVSQLTANTVKRERTTVIISFM